MQRRPFPIYNGAHKRNVLSSLNRHECLNLEGVSKKVTCAFLLEVNIKELTKLNNFKP